MRILICSDGSAQADRAIRFSGMIAAKMQADVTILAIAETSVGDEAVLKSMKNSQQAIVQLGLRAEIVIKAGEPVAEIVKHTEQNNYDLVVIGAVRKGRRGPCLMSAKAYNIIEAILPPVLVVIGNPTQLKQILICSGGERYIHDAVSVAGQMAKATGAAITLFHVMAAPPPVYADLIDKEENVTGVINSDSDLGRNLRREREALEAISVPAQVRLGHGLVPDEIFKEIALAHYDMVVIGSSPVGGSLPSYIMGNVTREIVNQSRCPVLVVRSSAGPRRIGWSLKGLVSRLTHSATERKEGADSN
jgi:nucleotide-binding universal stress UspA family protein